MHDVWWMALVLVLLVVLAVLALPLRRWWFTRDGGTFDCAVQLRSREPGVGWSLGFGRYHGEELQWFRAFSWGIRPRLRLRRGHTHAVAQRPAEGPEALVLYEDSQVVTLQDLLTGERHQLGVDDESAMALMSWLESAPPGAFETRHPSSPD